MIQVQKQDGSIEDFNWEKISEGVIKAGGTLQQGEKVAAEVMAWLQTVAQGGFINSQAIYLKCLEILKTVDSSVADKFQAYKEELNS